MGHVAGVLLAAGASSRLGQPKQLLRFRGQTLLRRAVEAGLGAGLTPLIVVIGAHAPAMRAELVGLRVDIVENMRYAEGQSTSLRAGLAALPATAQAAVLLLADMPGINAAVVSILVGEWRRSGAPIVRPTFEGRPGNPVLFSARLWPEMATATGDQGGRAVLRAHAAETLHVPVADRAVLHDVDTWEAYQDLLATEAADPIPTP